MALDIDTFSNSSGGFSFFKAIGHPLAAPRIQALLARLATAGPVAISAIDILASQYHIEQGQGDRRLSLQGP